MIRAIPPLQEGRFAIVTSVGSGMRWTRHVKRRMTLCADGEAVWSWHPKAGAKSVDDDRLTMVTKTSWTPGRARSNPLTPSRREGRMLRRTCG